MVSPSGFYKTARRKAEHLGIRCLDLEEVDSFHWLLAPGICSVTPKLLNQDWKFFPEEEGLVTKETMEVLAQQGTPLDSTILATEGKRMLNEFLSPNPEPTEKSELMVSVDGSGLILRNAKTGATTPVKRASVKLTYSVVPELIPFSLMQYCDKDDDQHIADVASAQLKIGDQTANVLIVHKGDEGG